MNVKFIGMLLLIACDANQMKDAGDGMKKAKMPTSGSSPLILDIEDFKVST